MSAARPSVYVTRRIPDTGLQLLRSRCEVSLWDSHEPMTHDELVREVVGKDALFCLLSDRIDKHVIEAAGPQLKVIGTMSVGYEHVDTSECARRGIPLGYTPEAVTDATAELTVSLLLATARRLVEGIAAVRSGEWSTWKPLWLCGRGIRGSTVGIVGLGRIGLTVARCIHPFNPAHILYTGHSPKPAASDIGAEFVTIDELLTRSDFVIATCPLTDQTRGMFDKSAFGKMKKTAILINTSRGGVVHQDDLYEALRDGEIAAAGLDVTTPEPLPTDHPLLELPNCVVLPHIGSATVETRGDMSEVCANNILAALNGDPMPHQVPV